MSLIDPSAARARRMPGKRPRQPLRLDMTALVSVSLLLLIFFVYRSSLGDTRQMELHMPARDFETWEGCGDIDEEKLLNVILANDKVYTWWNLSPSVTDSFPYDSLHTRLYAHLTRYPHRCAPKAKAETIRSTRCWDPVFIIKPRNNCRYQQFIGCLNELQRMGATKYSIDKETLTDSMIVQGTYAF